MFFLHRKPKSRNLLLVKTSVITMMAVSAITFSNSMSAFADYKGNKESTTIYKVYVNGTYAGNITNKEMVAQIEPQTKKMTKQQIEKTPIVQYIPEQVLNNTETTTKTVQNLKDVFQLKVEATAITIEGKPITYVDSKETAEQVLKSLKLHYLTSKQLAEVEAGVATTESTLPALKVDETRITDVRLSKQVSIATHSIEPEKILTLNDAVTYLQKGTLQEKVYTVQKGDVLETIAHSHGLTIREIIKLNPGITKNSLLKVGQKINITEPAPFVKVIVERETNQKEKIPFTTKVVKDSSMPKGETNVKQKGKAGLQTVIYKITEQNGSIVKRGKASQDIIKQPVERIIVKGTKVIPSRGEGSFSWPTVGGYISSQMGQRWGRTHKGIDIAGPSDRTIKAADNGVVVRAGWGSGYGNMIIIDHQNGYRTLYGHMSKLKVKAGQVVSKGMAIGVMGSTGNSTGVHLHFEVYKNGNLQNPLKYVNR
ncbi:M23 family metallopeptidase [Bacillus rubiinfantis]|uniref:M23 family metallopeptidase n=1 Tax=Bacillus rubiinfantis TaxID=1499680 RepID=UPI0005AA66D7|nr:M23 family metallopeptidase [Bacillus rubiinfantis]